MRQVGRAFGLALAAFLVTLLPATAMGQSGSRQVTELRFAEREPGVPTAVSFRVDYANPADPAAKPPAVRTVIEELAEGALIDTSVPGRCGASDPELMAQGAAACPGSSRVGSGTIRIDTGFPEPGRFIVADIVFLNNTDQLIFVSTERGSGARVVSRSQVRGRRIVNSAPPLPGTPPDGGAIDVVDTRLEEIAATAGGVRRGYITTPAMCPPDRDWINLTSFTYADGVTQTVPTSSPCSRKRPTRCSDARTGSPRRDRLTGTPESDRLFGFAGADRLRGRRGRDCLHGGRGEDVLRGGRGRDRLFGGPGDDVCRGGRGNDRFRSCERIVR